MIRKYVITILLLFIINIGAFAANIRDALSSIENGIFGYDYNKESDTKRIERLEEYIYGNKKTGTLQERLQAIQNDSGIVTEVKKPKKVQQNSFDNLADNQNIKKSLSNLKEDDTVEYPIVDKMEKELFKQTYKNENIYDRLNRLETTVFQHPSSEDLNTRVDKLASVLNPSGRRMPANETVSIEELERLYNNNGFNQIDEHTMPFQLAALEHDLLKHEYIGDNNSGRLSRLEQKLFNKTFPTEADDQRLKRVLAAYEAKKDSYKYENNRRMQNMATMSQIGGILLMILAILL